MAREAANDYDQRIHVKSKPSGYWTVNCESKVFPWSITYKLGEEFEWDMGGAPGVPEGVEMKMNCLETQGSNLWDRTVILISGLAGKSCFKVFLYSLFQRSTRSLINVM